MVFGGVSEDERILVYLSYYMLILGQFHLGMKVLAWDIDPIGIIKNLGILGSNLLRYIILKYPYLTVIKKL